MKITNQNNPESDKIVRYRFTVKELESFLYSEHEKTLETVVKPYAIQLAEMNKPEASEDGSQQLYTGEFLGTYRKLASHAKKENPLRSSCTAAESRVNLTEPTK